jgi:ectoine hydroxylase-related dioxygenase (phytanoyl-CoA dioxygenase family)
MPPQRLPSPTRDAEQALADLREHGICVLPEVLDGDTLARARDALYGAMADDDAAGRAATTGFALDQDAANRRVWNLLNRNAVFAELAEHPRAIAMVKELLGWPALLSNVSGNIVGPGARAGVLHADQVFVPLPWPKRPQGMNVGWCIDDFTRENGATEFVPGSHRLQRNPGDADRPPAFVPLEAAAGSAVVFESRLWHRTGANTSASATRAAVFAFYTTPVYRTQENWFLALDDAVVDRASDTLLTLLAYKTSLFGLVYGASPR